MTAEQQKIVAYVNELQAFLSAKAGAPLGDRAFLKYTPGFDAPVTHSTWNRIRSGDYRSKNLEKTLAALQRWAAAVRAAHSGQQTALWMPSAADMVDGMGWATLRAGVAVAIANAKLGKVEKLGWFTGKPGCGKTVAALRLRDLHPGAHFVIARHSWGTSYYAALEGVLRSTGFAGRLGSSNAGERELVSRLTMDGRGEPPIFLIDEFEYLTLHTIRLVKMLCNETAAVVVGFCQPEFLAGLKSSRDEHTRQLVRRSAFVAQADDISRATAAKFLGVDGEGAGALAKAANHFGGLQCCRDVAAALRGKAASREAVEAAATLYHATKFAA